MDVYASLFQNFGNAVVIATQHAQIIFANQSAYQYRHRHSL